MSAEVKQAPVAADTWAMPRGPLRAALLTTLTVVLAAVPAQAGQSILERPFTGGGNYFNTKIQKKAKADRNSDYWMAQIMTQYPAPWLNGPGGQFAPPVYVADAFTPLVRVNCPYCGEYTGIGEPPFRNWIEIPIPKGAKPDPSVDGHMTIMDPVRGDEWDLIGVVFDSHTGEWSARGAGHFDLYGDGHQDNLAGSGSATASRLPLSQAIAPAEVRRAIKNKTFLIPHALQFTAPNVDGRCWVYPALGSDGFALDGMPEGARIQLDPRVDVSKLPPGPRTIARTLQVYGAYLRDVGNALAFYLRPGPGWASLKIAGDSLRSIPTDRFRILRLNYSIEGTIQELETRVHPDCAAKDLRGQNPDGATRTDVEPPTMPGTVRVSQVLGPSGTHATVCWNRSSDNVGVVRYRVWIDKHLRHTPSGGARCSKSLKVRPGKHSAWVQAFDHAGNGSEPSPKVPFVTASSSRARR
jgi:hypothetical protein